MGPIVRRTDPRLQIMTEAIERLIPGAVPAEMIVYVIEKLADGGQHEWSGRPKGLAEKLFTALYGRPRGSEQSSPLAHAEDAKRRRDLGAELDILMGAGAALTSAPWYPARPGDVVHVAYEAAGTLRAASETYLVGDAGDGLMSLTLIACTFPGLSDRDATAMSGVFVAEAADEPLHELWFEAGPHRLTIIRDGRPVHIGGVR